MKTKENMEETIRKIQNSFNPANGFIPDHRVLLPVARAYLMAGTFSLVFKGTVRYFEPIATHIGCGVYQLTVQFH